MNKGVRRLAAALLIVLVLLQGMAVGALAADSETYTVRIFAGNVEGAAVAGQSVWTYTGRYGEKIPFDLSMVSLPENSKYSVRGVRKSGLDNNQVSPLGTITEDADYVIAYGITGRLVSYTINFVDQAGNTLAPSQVYYGNAGDKPVVAYLYIDDYLPQAYNLTRTLSENEANNVFTFVYTRIVRPTPVPTPTPTPEPEPTATPEPAAGNDNNAANDNNAPADNDDAPADNAPAEDNNAPAEDNAPEQEEITEDDAPLNNAPAEMIDLDEQAQKLPHDDLPAEFKGEQEKTEKPAAKEKTELQKDHEQKQTKFFVATALAIAALAVIVAVAIVLAVKRRGKRT